MYNETYKFSLETIFNHIETCEDRFSTIQTAKDFISSKH